MIGLIFGESSFPNEILKKIKKNKIKYLIIDLSRKKVFKKNKNSHDLSIGQFGKIIKILNEKKCKKVLFAGKVIKPNLKKIHLDFKGIYYFSKIIKSFKLGDAAILKQIIKILKNEKINTISSLTFNPELTLTKGIYSKIKPNDKDKKDIDKAIKILASVNKYNYTQGVVVRNSNIIALEDENGTDTMLRKGRTKLYKNSGVLVKFPKKKQDLRIDLPTIGIDTLKECKKIGLKGIVLKSKQNIFLDRKKCLNFVNKNKMFLTAI